MQAKANKTLKVKN